MRCLNLAGILHGVTLRLWLDWGGHWILTYAVRILSPGNFVICAERFQAQYGWCLEWRRYKYWIESCRWSFLTCAWGHKDDQLVEKEKKAMVIERTVTTGNNGRQSSQSLSWLPLGSVGRFCILCLAAFSYVFNTLCLSCLQLCVSRAQGTHNDYWCIKALSMVPRMENPE